MERSKLDHKSVPGIICQVTKHNNYRIVCEGGALKYYLIVQRFWVEPIKKAENYDLEDALQNWETKAKTSICEALHAISMMGGQGFFFCNCKGSCNKK